MCNGLIGEHRSRKALRDAVDGIEQIERRRRKVERLQVGDLVALEVHADQSLVLYRAGDETIFELGVEIALIGNITGEVIKARQLGRRWNAANIAVSEQRLELDVIVRKASILPNREVVGQILLELISDHFLFSGEFVDAGIAREQMGRNATERCVDHGADIGKKALHPCLVL